MRSGKLTAIAVTALIGCVLLAAAPPREVLDEPRAIRVELGDGTIVTGRMTAWDFEGLEGSFGHHAWTSLRAPDAWRLFRTVMDRDAADHWIALGKVMLQIENGGDEAEQAFAMALKLDELAAPLIEQARAEVDAIREAAERAQEELEKRKLRTMDPEGIDWPADLWPQPSADQRAAAIEQMRDAANTIMRERGLSMVPIETPLALVYSDLSRPDAAKLALTLEKAYLELANVLGLPADLTQSVLHGPAVIFIVRERDRFELLEAGQFNQIVPRERQAMCHCDAEKVFIVACEQPDADAMKAELICQFAHGVMHRVISPRRLPAWANEGLGWCVADRVLDDCKVIKAMRQRGLSFIRGGGDVARLMQMNYADETFPGEDRVAEAVGFLIVQLMIRERPREFAQWVAAIKLGINWIEALREDFGVEPASLPQTATQFYMVND